MGAQRRGGRSVLAALAAMVTVGLALGGCGDPDPAPGPSPTAPGSSSAAPEPSDSSSAAQAETPEEFIRRWVAADIAMQNTGETAEYRQLSRECDSCQDFADLVAGYYRAGGYIRTKGWAVMSVEESDVTARTRVMIVAVDSAPTRFRKASGAPVERLPGEQTSYRVSIRSVRSEWFVTDLFEVAS